MKKLVILCCMLLIPFASSYYATLGVGAGMDLSSGVNDAFMALQFTPVGISVGQKISWYFELGIGHAFMGFMTGLSWRF